MEEPYIIFKEKSCNELYNLQEEFKKVYDFDNHIAWHFDDGLGIFTLKFQDHAFYFEYVVVGSYSNNTQTWKWSWDNEYTPDGVKNGMSKVLEYGKARSFEDLTTGLIQGDREIGWEMTAMANQIIKGFGAYKAPSDYLDLYFLFTDEIDEESYKKIKEKYVDCGEHGTRRRAFICQHLNQNTKTGFKEAFPTFPDMEFEYEDDHFQGWCDECEKVRAANEGWNEESEKFAKIKIVCESCYFKIKDFNLKE